MDDNNNYEHQEKVGVGGLPRNVWAVSATSFLMDISSEMVINILPLFMANVLGLKTYLIGVIEGVAEATASLLKLFSGWLSDKVAGEVVGSAGVRAFALSNLSFTLLIAGESQASLGRRVGKGFRTAPRMRCGRQR